MLRRGCYSHHVWGGAVQAVKQPKVGGDRKQQLFRSWQPGLKQVPRAYPLKLLAPSLPPPLTSLAMDLLDLKKGV